MGLCCCNEYPHQQRLGENDIDLACTLQVAVHPPRKVRQEVKAGSWRLGWKLGPHRVSLYWFAPHDLVRLLAYTTEKHLPRSGTVPSGLALPTSSINQEIVPQTCLQVNLIDAFFNQDSFFPHDSGWNQVGNKLTGTQTKRINH